MPGGLPRQPEGEARSSSLVARALGAGDDGYSGDAAQGVPREVSEQSHRSGAAGGLTISADDQTWSFREPGVLADVMNVDPASDLEPFDAVQLTWPAHLQAGQPTVFDGQPLTEYEGPRILEARTPIASAYGRFGILAEPIAQGDVGKAWIAGVCLVNMLDPSSANPQVDRADTVEGQRKLRPCGLGAAQILWHDTTNNVGVVRLTTRLTTCVGLRNEGESAWGLGEVLVIKSTDGTADITITQVEPGVVRLEVVAS